MADEADIANERAQIELDAAIAAARGIPTAPRRHRISGGYCAECGNEIPKERQLAVPNSELCVHCATALERRAGAFRKAGQ